MDSRGFGHKSASPCSKQIPDPYSNPQEHEAVHVLTVRQQKWRGLPCAFLYRWTVEDSVIVKDFLFRNYTQIKSLNFRLSFVATVLVTKLASLATQFEPSTYLTKLRFRKASLLEIYFVDSRGFEPLAYSTSRNRSTN